MSLSLFLSLFVYHIVVRINVCICMYLIAPATEGKSRHKFIQFTQFRSFFLVCFILTKWLFQSYLPKNSIISVTFSNKKYPIKNRRAN